MIKTVECKKKTSPDCLGTITFDTDEHRFKNTCAKCAEVNLKVALKRQHTRRKLRPEEVGGNTSRSGLKRLVVKTHSEVAEDLGISESRVQQLERDALIRCAALLKSRTPIRTAFDEELDQWRKYAADLAANGETELAAETEKEIAVAEEALRRLRQTAVAWPEGGIG